MDIQFAVPEQPREQGERMTRQRLIDKRFLLFERLQRAATWGILFGHCRVRDLGKQFGGRTKSLCAPRIAPVPGLTQDELASGGSIPQVEPLCKRFSAYV
jgi:hypothetical protein